MKSARPRVDTGDEPLEKIADLHAGNARNTEGHQKVGDHPKVWRQGHSLRQRGSSGESHRLKTGVKTPQDPSLDEAMQVWRAANTKCSRNGLGSMELTAYIGVEATQEVGIDKRWLPRADRTRQCRAGEWVSPRNPWDT